MQGGTFDKLQDGIFCISVYWIGGEMRPMFDEDTTAVLSRRLNGLRRGRGRVGVGVRCARVRHPLWCMMKTNEAQKVVEPSALGGKQRTGPFIRCIRVSATEHTL